MRRVVALIFFALLAVRGIYAVEVECVAPGKLGDVLKNAGEIVSLTLKGEIDASDFETIGREVPSLRSLDLSDAVIKEYNGTALSSGCCFSPAGCMPSFGLFGSAIESVILPSGLTEVGDYAFAASHLKSVKIPSDVLSVGEGVFKDCTALVSADIECRLDTIPQMLFDGCVSLSCVVLPSDVKLVGDRAFAGCRSLKSVPAVASVSRMGDEAFACSGVTGADFSENAALESIGRSAFAMCGSLESVIFPESLTEISTHAFFCDSCITDFDMRNSSVALIGDFSLAGCGSIESVSLPETLSHIGDNAMEGMCSLKAIDAVKLSEVPELGSDVWAGIAQKSVDMTVSPAMLPAFVATPQWKEFNISSMSAVEPLTIGSPYRDIDIHFDGYNLIISSSGPSIEKASLYDLSGCAVYGSDLRCRSVEIDTSQWQSPFFVVMLWLAGAERPVSVKIIRQ